jgi:hypothetical protein
MVAMYATTYILRRALETSHFVSPALCSLLSASSFLPASITDKARTAERRQTRMQTCSAKESFGSPSSPSSVCDPGFRKINWRCLQNITVPCAHKLRNKNMSPNETSADRRATIFLLGFCSSPFYHRFLRRVQIRSILPVPPLTVLPRL